MTNQKLNTAYVTPRRVASRGFTIIELLVVIVVIAILAAISIVSYNGIQARARDVANDSNVTNILKIAELHRAQEGRYPGTVYNGEGDATRWNTTVDTTSSIYRNPSAPDWAPGSFVLNDDSVFDNWSSSVWLPNDPPGDFDDWGEYYDAAWAAYVDWSAANPPDESWNTDEQWRAYSQLFVDANPEYPCVPQLDIPCSEGSEHEIKREWMYFVDPLVDNGAGSTVCSNGNPQYMWTHVTGFRIRYYNETSKSWVEKRTGSGELGSFELCPM